MSKKLAYFSNLIYFLVVAIFVCVRIFANLGWFSFLGASGNYVMSLFTQIGLLLVFPLLMFKLLSKMKTKDMLKFYSVRKVSYKTVLVAIWLGVVVFFLNIYVSSFFQTIIQFLGYKPASGGSEVGASWGSFFLSLFCTAVLPGVCEEVLHRGMLLKGNSNLGMTKSIVISGLLFGLLHLNIEQFFYASIIGFFLGFLCWSCNSIIPGIIIHFMNNGISVFLSFAAKRGWAIGNFFQWISNFLTVNHFLGFVIFVLVLVLLVVIAWELVKFLITDNFKYNFERRQKELANLAIREAYFKQVEDIKNNREIPQSQVVYVEFKDFLNFVAKNMEKEAAEEKSKKIENIELKCKILLVASFVLSGCITFLTYIWGLFR